MLVAARDLMPVMRAALKRDQQVRLTTTGTSMFPFILGGDEVILEPLHRLPRLGEVVLVECHAGPADERYLLHRVVRVQGGTFFLRGDSQRQTEGPFGRADLLGRAIRVCRHGRTRRLDRGFWRQLGLAWVRCAPVNFWFFRLACRLCPRLL